jgi:hypothetical protein
MVLHYPLPRDVEDEEIKACKRGEFILNTSVYKHACLLYPTPPELSRHKGNWACAAKPGEAEGAPFNPFLDLQAAVEMSIPI